MSTARQAIAARRMARIDPRYRGQKSHDATVSKRRLDAKIHREKMRAARKGLSKK